MDDITTQLCKFYENQTTVANFIMKTRKKQQKDRQTDRQIDG